MPIWLLGILKYGELVNDGPIAADGLKILYRLYRNARKHPIVLFLVLKNSKMLYKVYIL
jgi:hypothetical protein